MSEARVRTNLAGVLDQVIDQQEIVIVRRKGGRDVALVPAAEWESLTETSNLLRSPRNRRRLLRALRNAEKGEGIKMSPAQLRRETGLGRKT